MRAKIAAGNWKMNGLSGDISELVTSKTNRAEVIMGLPATLIARAHDALSGSGVKLAGQNAHAAPSGAYTGEISMGMLKDAGASHVILGHSERRDMFGETDAIIRAKAKAAINAGLVAIICVGETLAEREAGQALSVVETQIKGSVPASSNGENTIIAYEPVWAIGTGKVPSNDDIAEIHAKIRAIIPDSAKMRVLYGGSVKPTNAEEIFAIENVDGGLVGGASLKASDFIPIINAAEKLS